MSQQSVLNTLIRERDDLQKALSNIIKAFEQGLIQKIVVYDDRLEIFFNYTKENNPDDTSRQDYLLPKCSTCYGMVETEGLEPPTSCM